MTNEKIADAFDLIADLLEFQGANSFRVRAYRNSARTLRDYSGSLAELAQQGVAALKEIEGIGDDLAAKIIAMVETGKLAMLDELRSQVPESVLALLRIPGVGPKKAAALYKELGVKSLEELKSACEQGKVRELKGFAAKTEQLILQGLTIAAAGNERMLWYDADKVVQALLAHMRPCQAIEKLEVAGSYRRGKDSIGDLDLLVISRDVAGVMDHFAKFPPLQDVIARGDTKMSIRLDSNLQVDLRVVGEESFGAALQYFTGSKEHNVKLRSLAKERGLKINEYGVYRVEADGSETLVAGSTEAEVYATVDLPCFPPESREGRWEYEAARHQPFPALVELADIVCDLHMHTTATDGNNSIDEMATAARVRGMQYIAITDHSQRVSVARGLTPDRVLAEWKKIDAWNAANDDEFVILKGIECDILEAGGMDLPDDVLAQGDFIIGSVHFGQKQSRAEITERILFALEHPHVHMIAHPTGRLINRREPYEVDITAVIAAAKKHKKLLEINANPQRLDLNEVLAAQAREAGVMLSINTDAHHTGGMDVMRCGILQARRAGATKADIANTLPLAKFKKLVLKK